MRCLQNSVYDRYFANLYNDSNAITEEDLAGLDITPEELAGFITLCEQFEKFLENQSVTTGDYRSTLMKLYKKNI